MEIKMYEKCDPSFVGMINEIASDVSAEFSIDENNLILEFYKQPKQQKKDREKYYKKLYEEVISRIKFPVSIAIEPKIYIFPFSARWYINPTISINEKLVKNIFHDYDALSGVISHEFGHLEDYATKNDVKRIEKIVNYAINNKFPLLTYFSPCIFGMAEEFRAEKNAIEAGYLNYLILEKREILKYDEKAKSKVIKRLKKVKKLRFPEDTLSIILNNLHLGEYAALNTSTVSGWRKREIEYLDKKREELFLEFWENYLSEEEFKKTEELLKTLTHSELWDYKAIEKIVIEWIEHL